MTVHLEMIERLWTAERNAQAEGFENTTAVLRGLIDFEMGAKLPDLPSKRDAPIRRKVEHDR